MDIGGFLIGIGLQAGSSLLGSLFGGNKKPPITQTEVNFLETHDEPSSSYGTAIAVVYGKCRVQGIYIAAQVPYDWERDDYFDAARREWILTYIYYGNCGVMWTQTTAYRQTPIIRRIWMNKEIMWEEGNWNSQQQTYWGRFPAAQLTHNYDRTTPDNRIGFLGSNHTAFRKSFYTTINKLRLNNSDGGLFNSRYPNMEAEVDTYSTGSPTLGGIIEDMLLNAGYQAHEFDVTELNAIAVKGFLCMPGRLSEKLGILQMAYFFEVVDTGAKLKFITAFRSGSAIYIPATALGCREDGGEQPPLFEESETPVEDLPTRIRVKYNDAHNYYQPGSIESFELNPTGVQNVQDIDTGLTLTESEALAIANKQLVVQYSRRRKYKFTVSARYGMLEAGDVIDVEQRGAIPTAMQITRINNQPQGLVAIEAHGYDGLVFGLGWTVPAAYQNTTVGTPGTPIDLGQIDASLGSITNADGSITYVEGVDYSFTDGVVTIISGGNIDGDIVINWQGDGTPPTSTDLSSATVAIQAIDINHPSDSDARGIYVFAYGDGATIYTSRDGTNYSAASTINSATIGIAQNILPDSSGGVDNVSTLSVTLSTPYLFPASGRILCGAEILDYSTIAYDPATDIYTLSGFVRALRRTTGTGHVASEGVYLLSGNKYTYLVTPADIGTTFYFKAVTPGQLPADVAATSLTFAGHVLKALRPAISDFSPREGDIGTAIAISGEGFNYSESANINGINLDNIVIVSDAVITGNVAATTTTGKITVVEDSTLSEVMGDGESLADFVIVEPGGEWGTITGTINDQTDLWSVLSRTRIYTYIVGNVTVPAVGQTVDVTVVEDYGFGVGVPVSLFRTSTVGDPGGGGYAQLNCTAVNGKVLTLIVESIGRQTQTSFLSGDIIAPIVEQTVGLYGGMPDGIQITGNTSANQYYGTDANNVLGYYDVQDGARKAKHIRFLTTDLTLTLSSAYLQLIHILGVTGEYFVRLPLVTATDYFEVEIVNTRPDVGKAMVIQENDGTPIVTLNDDVATGKVRSVYCYWDTETWQVWIRGYY